jgi:hypothetical protein
MKITECILSSPPLSRCHCFDTIQIVVLLVKEKKAQALFLEDGKSKAWQTVSFFFSSVDRAFFFPTNPREFGGAAFLRATDVPSKKNE